ncbi:MAG: transcriptional repressor NrdR [Spirochaetales bacterium]|nr:transcriptional repressor NrdR [Spirochaetales bacterium]
MRCPYCGETEDKVIESRMLLDAESIRRRRECIKCGYRFTTHENIEEKMLMVIKRDGSREPFDISKIERGIRRAMEKRPIPQMVVEEILVSLENQAMMVGRNSHEIAAAQLGEMVLEHLYSIDKVAYIRFASVYRSYENMEQFVKEIESLTQNKKTKGAKSK